MILRLTDPPTGEPVLVNTDLVALFMPHETVHSALEMNYQWIDADGNWSNRLIVVRESLDEIWRRIVSATPKATPAKRKRR